VRSARSVNPTSTSTSNDGALETRGSMSDSAPQLRQFRVEIRANGLAHLVFDAPDRSMNVFTNAAIHELGEFCRWLAASSVRGVVIRSGKASAFCVGADLTELGSAYDVIVQSMPSARFNVAFDHFFPLSAAIRALETAGKPVAAAIAGLALGGGCELAMGAHYRVLVDVPSAALGLPESLVGLLPGAGGTQRLPRLVGLECALPVLLDGARLSGAAALDAGLVNEVVPPGEEIAAAEKWLLSKAVAQQLWIDRTGARRRSANWIPSSANPVPRCSPHRWGIIQRRSPFLIACNLDCRSASTAPFAARWRSFPISYSGRNLAT